MEHSPEDNIRSMDYVNVAINIGVRNLSKPEYYLARHHARRLPDYYTWEHEGCFLDSGAKTDAFWMIRARRVSYPCTIPASAELQEKLYDLHQKDDPFSLQRLIQQLTPPKA